MSSRLRQLVARAVSVLPNRCPPDLEAWVQRRSLSRSPLSPQSPGCRIDSLHNGACACAELGNPVAKAAQLSRLADGYEQAPRAALEMVLGGRCKEHDNLADWCLTCAATKAPTREG